MPRKPQPWFRFYVEMPRDPKIRRLSPVHRWVWACVLCVARESPISGFLLISERLPLEPADLADLAAVKEAEVRRALTAMEQLGLVERDLNLGCLFVPKFTDRQYESDSSTERSRKHRSRNVDATLQRRSSNGRDDVDATSSSRARATEAEAETETEDVELDQGEERPVTLRAAPATKPTLNPINPADARCTAHIGVADPGPCKGCKAARENAERKADRVAEQIAREAEEAARNCPDCHGSNWRENPDGTPVEPAKRCTHPRIRRTA